MENSTERERFYSVAPHDRPIREPILDSDRDRAKEMLTIAAKYIREYWPDGYASYDETECDGYCIADDCESAAGVI